MSRRASAPKSDDPRGGPRMILLGEVERLTVLRMRGAAASAHARYRLKLVQ